MLEEHTPDREESPFVDESAELPLDCHGASVAGSAHAVNQDDYLLAPLGTAPAPTFLFAVADGIGGGPAGDRASGLAIQTLHEFVRKTVSQPEVIRRVDPADVLRKGVIRSHEAILADIEAHPELFGMGTTLTAALVMWPTVWVVHAGDSRCYRLRGSALERLTLDHTLVQKFTAEGIVTPGTSHRSRWRHALWNHLGKRSGPLDPEVVSADLRPGDALLLTTDGITDPLLEGELSARAAEPGPARSVARAILRAAEEKGGRDDMTLIFARFARPAQ